MTNRTKKIVGVIILVIILLLLLIWWLLSRQAPAPVVNLGNQSPTNAPAGSLNVPSPQPQPPVTEITQPPAAEPEKADPRSTLRALAMAFAERYGSYSNQSNYENLEELRALMTAGLTAKTNDFIAQERAKTTPGAAYVGYTTRAISADVTLFDQDAGTATVKVSTQRQEIKSSGIRVYYQPLELQFVRQGEVWKADSVTWAAEGG